jgi:hypothetical protein
MAGRRPKRRREDVLGIQLDRGAVPVAQARLPFVVTPAQNRRIARGSLASA